jgi:hypothetical protein
VQLALTWERANVTQKLYSFSADPDLRVPSGRKLRVMLGGDGNYKFGSCSIIGDRITG